MNDTVNTQRPFISSIDLAVLPFRWLQADDAQLLLSFSISLLRCHSPYPEAAKKRLISDDPPEQEKGKKRKARRIDTTDGGILNWAS